MQQFIFSLAKGRRNDIVTILFIQKFEILTKDAAAQSTLLIEVQIFVC